MHRAGEVHRAAVHREPSSCRVREDQKLVIVFGVLWIVIGFIACILGGER
jgi:hypothetical protein